MVEASYSLYIEDIFLLNICPWSSVDLRHLLLYPLSVLYHVFCTSIFLCRLFHTESIAWQASDLQECDGNLVGSKVRVWWPMDRAWVYCIFFLWIIFDPHKLNTLFCSMYFPLDSWIWTNILDSCIFVVHAFKRKSQFFAAGIILVWSSHMILLKRNIW